MRVNIYGQEITNEIEVVSKKSNTGIVYPAVRLFLHSSEKLHHTADDDDDDRSAITLWLLKSRKRKLDLANTLKRMSDEILLLMVE